MDGASRATNQRKYNAFSSLASRPDLKRIQVRPEIVLGVLDRLDRGEGGWKGFHNACCKTGAEHDALALTRVAQFA